MVKKFTFADVLHNKEKLVWGFNDLIKLDDVRMTDLFEDVYFTGNPPNISYIYDFTFLKDFDGDFFLGLNMDS